MRFESSGVRTNAISTGDETENLGGGVVEPSRVVDDADKRLLLGDLGEQRQRGQADQEPVWRQPLAMSSV